MDDAWRPNAPDLDAHFESARDDAGREPAAPSGQDIATRAELDGLTPRTPVPEPRLTIGGAVQREVDGEVQRENDLRAAFLRRSLEKASRNLNRDIERSR